MTALSLGILSGSLHSLLNLLTGPCMTGQTLLRPSRQAEAMIEGLTDVAPSLGVTSNLFPLSGLSPSRGCTATVHAGSVDFGEETRK